MSELVQVLQPTKLSIFVIATRSEAQTKFQINEKLITESGLIFLIHNFTILCLYDLYKCLFMRRAKFQLNSVWLYWRGLKNFLNVWQDLVSRHFLGYQLDNCKSKESAIRTYFSIKSSLHKHYLRQHKLRHYCT